MSDPNEGVTPIEGGEWRAAVLAGVGGFVDAAGFLVILGLFTAHMSGNSTGLGVALATGHWDEALRRGFVIPVYVLATFAGVAWIESRAGTAGRSRAIAGVLGVEAVMLLIFMAVAARIGEPVSLANHPLGFFVTATAATFAMGLQNAALRRVQTTAVHTTFVTGMLTEMSVATVRWILHARRGQSEEAARARKSAAITSVIWSNYLIGAFVGAWLVFQYGAWTLALPLLILLTLIATMLQTARSSEV